MEKNKIALGIIVALVAFWAMSLHAAAATPEGMVIPEGCVIAELDPSDFYTAEEIDMLERLTMAEAGNQDLEVQTLVALVVLNRTANDDFPDTIEEVINQKTGKTYQFSCVPNGMFASAKPTDQVKEAVRDALYSFVNDMREVPDKLLYFNSIGYFKWGTVANYAHKGAMYFSVAK